MSGGEAAVALSDVLAQHGVDPADRAGVFSLLVRLPLAPRSRVELWGDYLAGRGETMSADERARLSA